MSEKRKNRKFAPEQKAEIVLAGLRGDRTARDICREYEIAETLYNHWRDRLLEGCDAALATSRDRDKVPRDVELLDAKKRIGQLKRPGDDHAPARCPTHFVGFGAFEVRGQREV